MAVVARPAMFPSAGRSRAIAPVPVLLGFLGFTVPQRTPMGTTALAGAAALVVIRAPDDDVLVQLQPSSEIALVRSPFSFRLGGTVRGRRGLHLFGIGAHWRGETTEWRPLFVR